MLEKVSEEIANGYISVPKRRFYAIFFILSALISVLSVVSYSYFDTKITNYVMKSDFENTLIMLKSSVESTEKIQQEIRSKFSSEAEAKKLLREKYENIYLSTMDFNQSLDDADSLAISYKFPYGYSTSLAKMRMLQSLYFPLLKDELATIDSEYVNYFSFLIEISKQSSEERKNDDNFAEKMVFEKRKLLESIEQFRSTLINKYSTKLNL